MAPVSEGGFGAASDTGERTVVADPISRPFEHSKSYEPVLNNPAEHVTEFPTSGQRT